MTMTAQEYRANARQCLFWAESASDPENRDAFFALAATWESAAARIEKSTAVPEIRATQKPSLRRAAAGYGPRWTCRPLRRASAAWRC
jgi:hypothetical protein